MMKSYDLKLISKWRTELMGFAAVMILLCHSVVAEVEMPSFIKKIMIYGNLGVDLFLLLSGFGMFYSCRKRLGGGAKTCIMWYKLHLLRIFIPYVIILGPYWIFDCIVEQRSIIDFVLRFTTLSFWVEHVGAWYVAFLIPLYLFVPVWNYIFDRINRKWIIVLMMIGINMLLGLFPFDNSDSLIDNIIFCLRRVPSFFVGWYFAYLNSKDIKMPMITIGCSVLLFVVGQVYISSICWYWVAAIAVVMLLSLIFNGFEKIKALNFFRGIGKCSLESYLTNYLFMFVLAYLPIFNLTINHGNYLYYGLVLLFGIISAFLYHRICSRIIQKGKSA